MDVVLRRVQISALVAVLVALDLVYVQCVEERGRVLLFGEKEEFHFFADLIEIDWDDVASEFFKFSIREEVVEFGDVDVKYIGPI